MRSLLIAIGVAIALTRWRVRLGLDARRDGPEGAAWREFGLRQALAHMPRTSPGRAVIEALLARGSLTDEEGRRFKAQGLRNALASLPPDSPGRVVVETLLARDVDRRASGPEPQAAADDRCVAEPVAPRAEQADLLGRLERLVSLHERGHLADREFEAAKRKLLD
jgi:Short C-terminal domain